MNFKIKERKINISLLKYYKSYFKHKHRFTLCLCIVNKE